MNTKGIKFLAVVAVMAMAFAAFAVFAPAEEQNDATAVKIYGNAEIDVDPTYTTNVSTQLTKIYISDDATVKVKGQASQAMTFYVQNGKILELDIKVAQTQPFTIYTVTGDLEKATTSAGSVGGANGKAVLETTAFTFQGEAGQTVYYKAAYGEYKVTYSDGAFTGVWDWDDGYHVNAMVGADKAFTNLTALAFGGNVTVAGGQTIEIVNSSVAGAVTGLTYGIYFKDTSGQTTSGTYYAPSSNVGTIEFVNAADSVTISSGSVAITTSGTSVKAVSAVGVATPEANPVVVTGNTSVEGLVVSGALKSGDLTFSGKVSTAASFASGGTVTIANKSEIGSTTIANTGKVVVKAGNEILSEPDNPTTCNLTVTGSGTLVLQNEKLWNPSNTTSLIINTTGVSGLVDTSAITKTFEGKQDISTSIIAENQTYELIENTTVSSDLTVKGILIVDPGVTFTVEENAKVILTGKMSQIINNGKIIVKAKGSNHGISIEGGAFVNNGTIELTAKAGATGNTFSVSENAVKFENNGNFSVSKNDTVAFDKFTNGSKGTFTVNGSISKVGAKTTITNSGKVVINGTTITANTEITIKGSGSLSITSMKLSSAGYFKVIGKDGTTTTGTVQMTTSGSDAATIRGLTVSGTKIWSVGYLDVKGSMGVAMPTQAGDNDTVTMAFTKNISVSDSFTVPKSVTLAFDADNATNMNVAGNMSINKDSKKSGVAANSLALTVTGRVYDGANSFGAATYYAAKYQNADNSVVYTTLKKAIEEAEIADVMTVTTGIITVSEDITIPAEMTVEADSIIYVGANNSAPVSVYVEPTGRFVANTAIYLVNGSIYAEDSTDIDSSSVHANVVVQEDGEEDILFQSLNVALAAASPGDTIVLESQAYVLSRGSIEIPAGVKVDATVNNTPFILIASEMDVLGTLIVNDFKFVAENNDDIGITVVGFIKDGTPSYSEIPDHWFTPVGVSYEETTLDYNLEEITYYVITSLDNLQAAVFAADDSKVTVEGKAKLGDVTIIGTEDQPAEVTFNDDVSAGTITLDNAIIIAKPGNEISATFADEYGAITIRGAYVAEGRKDVNIYSLGENGVYMSGPINDTEDGTYYILFEGKTGMNNAVIGWGKYAEEPAVYPTVTFAGDTLATGNKNQILNINDNAVDKAGIVTVAGSLTADNGSRIYIAADVDVLGTLAAKEAVTGTTNGTVNVAGDIFLGATQATIYDGDAAIAAYGYTTGTATYGHKVTGTRAVATLAGKIVMDETDELKYFITAMAGTEIEESIIEDMKSMDIVIDGVLWLTVYGTSSYSMDGLKAPIKDCTVDKIYDVNGREIAKFSQKYGVIYDNTAAPLDSIVTVYITVDYAIFEVVIKTDASIKAVYIDNILTYTGQNENQFVMPRMEAGTHTVSVEPATGYTADKAYLYTDLGTLLKGLKFTFNEDDCIVTEDANHVLHYTVVYNVAGTEKIVDPEPLPPEQVSEWTVTTILLLVLVILIAIMAVIVALRLNRS